MEGNENVASAAFERVRSIGAKPITVTQSLPMGLLIHDGVALTSESMGFTLDRLRNNLRRYRFAGDELEREVVRIAVGPTRTAEEMLKAGSDQVVYPFGWHKHEMTRLMKRIFHGHGKRVVVVFDEAWALLGQLPNHQDHVRQFRYGN